MNKQQADKIITEYIQKIFGFAIKKSFTYTEAEELCSDILTEVYTSLLHMEEIANIEGYIWRIGEHTYSKFVSSKKKHQGVSIDNIILPYYEDYTRLEAQEEIDKLRMEVAFLTETRRNVVYSHYFKSKSIRSISAEMGIPEGTVKWHLNKARNELKECYTMERKIGPLGLNPVTATGFSHSGDPGNDLGTKTYLGDKLNLNIVYSVYHTPKKKKEIAEELGITPVFIEDRIKCLEENGFMIKLANDKYTTFVEFSPEKYSLEEIERKQKIQLEMAEIISITFPKIVIDVMADFKDVYIPGGNRDVFNAACVFHGISKSCIPIQKDISHHIIKTTAGGSFYANVQLCQERSDPDYIPTLSLPNYWVCGQMIRESEKYSNVASYSYDSRYCSRKGCWKDNLTSNYEYIYIYEYITNAISDNNANSEKFNRLRQRKFITDDNKVNIMVVKDKMWDFLTVFRQYLRI